MRSIVCALEHIRTERAKEAVERAQSCADEVPCPFCGATLSVESTDGECFVFCESCLFATSADSCGE
ncbi:hypothetical protein dsx2_2393 [Desulfovibrio sp. X2]|uniref:hypothetical protein n=1 Tax=Desulfovibrio sp. X2 TaxID=941449 RepID=UPI00035897A2|nr:hypothetical protein [Desulfovibrio sp. X2]EPR43416.1 hypothetical protein dsx2_2393 [Desulfovibrio sp. X2]